MKTVIFVAALFLSTTANAWWGPGYGPGFGYGPGWGYGGYGGYGMMPYGLMGYGYAIPQPSFNYNTVIQQSPPVIINEAPAYQQPAPVYNQPSYNCATNTCR